MITENNILDKLSKGKALSNRAVYDVLPYVLTDRKLLNIILQGCRDSVEPVKTRCIVLLEKISEIEPEWLAPHKAFIFEELIKSNISEAQWAIAKMLPRLALSEAEYEQAFSYCLSCFNTTSSRILMAVTLDTIVSIAKLFPSRYAYQANHLLEQALCSPIPSLAARARKLAKMKKKLSIFNAAQ